MKIIKPLVILVAISNLGSLPVGAASHRRSAHAAAAQAAAQPPPMYANNPSTSADDVDSWKTLSSQIKNQLSSCFDGAGNLRFQDANYQVTSPAGDIFSISFVDRPLGSMSAPPRVFLNPKSVKATMDIGEFEGTSAMTVAVPPSNLQVGMVVGSGANNYSRMGEMPTALLQKCRGTVAKTDADYNVCLSMKKMSPLIAKLKSASPKDLKKYKIRIVNDSDTTSAADDKKDVSAALTCFKQVVNYSSLQF